MKIAVIGCFYGSADLLSEVLKPWVELKAAGKPIVLMGINAQFKEYADLGYPNDDIETRAVLEEHRSFFDHLILEEKPLQEHEVRNQLLELSRMHGVDAVWLLDGDELYTRDQIESILAYCIRVPEFDYYHIHFQNIVLDTKRSRDPFLPPRIIRTDRHGGIKTFTWDNEIQFMNGKALYDLIPGIVPRRIAHVRHLTWRKKDAAKKIAYSEKHFGFSIFKIDPVTQEVSYNREWFDFYHQPVPVEYPDGSVGTPMPSYELRYIVRKENSQEEVMRSLWSLVRALLVLEHANEVELSFSCYFAAGSEPVEPRVRSFLNLFSIAPRYYKAGEAHSFSSPLADLTFFSDSSMLFEKNALCNQFLSQRHFSQMFGHSLFLTSLFDSVALYETAGFEKSRVVRGTGSHWRTVSEVEISGLLVPVAFFQTQTYFQDTIKEFAQGILRVFRSQNICFAFTPMPSLAHSFLKKSPFKNQENLWNELRGYPKI